VLISSLERTKYYYLGVYPIWNISLGHLHLMISEICCHPRRFRSILSWVSIRFPVPIRFYMKTCTFGTTVKKFFHGCPSTKNNYFTSFKQWLNDLARVYEILSSFICLHVHKMKSILWSIHNHRIQCCCRCNQSSGMAEVTWIFFSLTGANTDFFNLSMNKLIMNSFPCSQQ